MVVQNTFDRVII